jgi:hypothetical protein
MSESTKDTKEDVAKGAFKLDTGKVAVYQGFVQRFPRAIEAVAAVSQFGHDKYGTWDGWASVPDGINRYLDAKCRHMVAEAKGEVAASDSKLMHAAHEAWGAMATLELKLREMEDVGK